MGTQVLSGVQENRGGKGRSRCWSSPASWSPTAFSHGSDPSYMSEAPGISDRSPFYREHAPVGALDTETCPPLKQRSLGGGKKGGGDLKERGQAWWGGEGEVGARKGICDLKHLLSWEKTQRTVHLVPPHFFPR